MLRVVLADLTTLRVDAIVNAANESLLGGGGVDGAIHAAAGPGLLAACRALPQVRPGVRCPTGEARLTAGFELPARWIVHTVGPVWRGGGEGEADALAACYRRSFALAATRSVASIAFPAISCGIYGYPSILAATIALREMRAAIATARVPLEVVACCFSARMLSDYRDCLGGAARVLADGSVLDLNGAPTQ